MLRLQDISKNYYIDGKAIKALKNISIDIKEGESISIIGPSGSGKSTLLHLMAGLDKPSKGEVLFMDNNIFNYGDKDISNYRNQNVGFVFQQFHLQDHLTIEENVTMPMYFSRKNNKSKIDKAVKQALKEVGLSDRADHKPTEVSGGQAQRAAIARAIINSPKLILADEPTGDLDIISSQEILKLLLKLNKEKGITLIIVTHEPKIAESMGRIIKLKNGEIN